LLKPNFDGEEGKRVCSMHTRRWFLY